MIEPPNIMNYSILSKADKNSKGGDQWMMDDGRGEFKLSTVISASSAI